jgi:predicted kinase
MNATVIILSGIPTSGKTRWANKYTKANVNNPHKILSRDEIRLGWYGNYAKIPFNKETEDAVTLYFNRLLNQYIQNKVNIIIDNTHCKDSYIKELLKKFAGQGYTIKIKFFDIPLWKAYYRNVKRRILEKKNIPVSVLKAMKKNYDKINKEDYARFTI